MRQCWNEDPANRPSFDDICVRLEEILTELALEYACCSSYYRSPHSLTAPPLPNLPPCFQSHLQSQTRGLRLFSTCHQQLFHGVKHILAPITFPCSDLPRHLILFVRRILCK